MKKIQISDFSLASAILRFLCEQEGSKFIDVPISFENEQDGTLFIGKTENIAHTLFQIVNKYIEQSLFITGKELIKNKDNRDDFLIMIANNLRYFVYKNERFYSQTHELHMSRLYQKPLIWLLMKDIICPIFDKPIENIRLICGETPYIDIAKYYREGEAIWASEKNYPFIFVNNIDNLVVQSAFLFIETIKSYNLSPLEVITRLYKSDIYDKFRGLLDLSLEEDEIINFEAIIVTVLGIESYDEILNKIPLVKVSQRAPNSFINQWWNLGILEKSVETMRGTNWSVYKNLQPYVEQFWNQVEEVRKQRKKAGHDEGVPFDLLLRIKAKQTSDFKTDPNKTLQALLSSNRIW